MNVPEIRGPGNLHPRGEGKAGRAKARSAGREVAGLEGDRITLSPEFSRQALEVDRFVGLAKKEEAGRAEVLARVRRRLDSGDLNRPEVFRRTARKILAGK